MVVENNFVYSHAPDPTDLYNNGDPDPGDNRSLKRLRPHGILTADENYSFTPPANLENITIANNVIVNCRSGIGHYGQASGSGLKNVHVLHNTIVVPSELLENEGQRIAGVSIPFNKASLKSTSAIIAWVWLCSAPKPSFPATIAPREITSGISINPIAVGSLKKR